MAWWFWGTVSWAAITTLAVLYLAAVSLSGRRRARSPEPVTDDEPLPGVVEEALAGTPAERGSAVEAPVPVRWQPDTTSPARAGSAEPDRLLARLEEGARTGNYTLPQRLVDALRACRLLGELHLPEPVPLGRSEAAARLVSAAIATRSPDPVGLCREMHRSRTDRLLHQEALELLRTAIRYAQDAAVREASEAGDAIIVDHLQPAYREVMHRAREIARRLGPYIDDDFRLDTPRIITARLRVRTAYLALPELVRRHSSLLGARECANGLAERTPCDDSRGLFSVFENPLAFSPAAGLPYEDTPVPPLPDDETARLLWLVSEEGLAGRPWLPTVAEQDAAWRAHFGRPVHAPPQATSGRPN